MKANIKAHYICISQTVQRFACDTFINGLCGCAIAPAQECCHLSTLSVALVYSYYNHMSFDDGVETKAEQAIFIFCAAWNKCAKSYVV